MTEGERLEYARLVKTLDVALGHVQPAYWPLVLPAVELMHHVEHTRYVCQLCHQSIRKPDLSAHRCSCPVTSARRGLRARTRCR